MINPGIHHLLSIGLVLLISSAGIVWGTQAFADNHCSKNDDKKCNHSEKNQKSTSKGPVITINPTSGPSASLVTVTGNGFDPSSTVAITFNDTDITTVTTTNNGEFFANFTVPLSSSVGFVQVVATQGSNSASETVIVTSSLGATSQPNVNATAQSNVNSIAPSSPNLSEIMMPNDIFA